MKQIMSHIKNSMKEENMNKNELMVGTFMFHEESEIRKILSEFADSIVEAINRFYHDDILDKYNEMTGKTATTLLYVSSNDFSKILLHPIIRADPQMQYFANEEEAINGMVYKTCIFHTSIKIVFINFPFYKGKPTCNIKEVWRSI